MSANRPISETLVEDSYYPPCNQDVFKRGIGLVAVDGWAKDVEPWVRRVAELSGQLVDWHYSGGVANVLVLGDHAKATAAAKILIPSPGIRVMRWFSDGASLFRAGDPVPEGTVGVDASATFLSSVGSCEPPKGLHPYRFKDNPDEAKFAEIWAKSGFSDHLKYLLCEGDQHYPAFPSDRDVTVAATVIQWLGSPVGQQFLEEVGFKKP